MLIFDFLKMGLGIISPSNYVYDFLQEMFFTLYSIKGYFPYKTIFCFKVALDVFLMNFLFKKMFHSQDIPRFVCFVKSPDSKI